jgi:hypothetical protein
MDKHIKLLKQLLVYHYKSKNLNGLAKEIEDETNSGEVWIKVHIIEKLW